MYEARARYGRSFGMVLKIGTKLLHNLGSQAAVIDCMALSLSQKLGSAGVDMVKGMGGRGMVG